MKATWLPSSRNKNGTYVQELLDEIFLPAALVIIKILGHSNFDSLEAKGNHLYDLSTRNAALKETNSSQTASMAWRDISPNDNLEKVARKAQTIGLRKQNPQQLLEIQL